MKSLNLDKGFSINELEAFILIVDKMLEEKLQVNPKAGIVLAKGRPNEKKVRYKDLKKVLSTLELYFSQKGCLSFGICRDCGNFNGAGYFSNCKGLGRCRLNSDKEVNAYDSCSRHTVDTGGFGL